MSKLSHARDLLQLLPNVDVSQAEQEEESRQLERRIQRKKQLIQAFKIQMGEMNAEANEHPAPLAADAVMRG